MAVMTLSCLLFLNFMSRKDRPVDPELEGGEDEESEKASVIKPTLVHSLRRFLQARSLTMDLDHDGENNVTSIHFLLQKKVHVYILLDAGGAINIIYPVQTKYLGVDDAVNNWTSIVERVSSFLTLEYFEIAKLNHSGVSTGETLLRQVEMRKYIDLNNITGVLNELCKIIEIGDRQPF